MCSALQKMSNPGLPDALVCYPCCAWLAIQPRPCYDDSSVAYAALPFVRRSSGQPAWYLLHALCPLNARRSQSQDPSMCPILIGHVLSDKAKQSCWVWC